MSTVQFPDRQEVQAQAAEWIAMIDRGMTLDEERALTRWIDESPLHGETLVKCASMWDLLDVLSPIAKLLPIEHHSDNESTHGSVAESRHGGSHRFAIAASLVALFGAALFVFQTVENHGAHNNIDELARTQTIERAEQAQRYTTAVGEISEVSLEDGSTLKLNTDSEVLVKFSQDQRRIVLQRGEVFFDVAKNPERPFIVTAESEQVTAIGTAFNVDLSEETGTEVLVTEGRVVVNRVSMNDVNERADINPYQAVYLSKGQKVVIRDNQTLVSEPTDVDLMLAWQDGMLVFEGESLAQAIREIDRYTPLSFKIVDQEIATIPVGGFFKTGDMDQLLLILEQNFGVRSVRKGNAIMLSKATRLSGS